MVDVLAAKQEQSGVKLLWGTANCFTNPRYGAGAATNPDPEVFSWAATQVVTAMNARINWAAKITSCGAGAKVMKRC
ncbi:xylose isomerase [Salmonella enterica subsp. enterica]|uniref:Xylose isomerase n=1 Tax=Salmonella enterica I TaxID=59201 RepID=A0A379W0W3_SALET|nr:xylose isomerase [Salmonella enterica subsp. enterica]